MSKDFKSSEERKQSYIKKAALIIVPAIVIILSGFYLTEAVSSDVTAKEETADIQAQAPTEAEVAQKNAKKALEDKSVNPSKSEDDSEFDVQAALSERAIGSNEAPLVIHEYSSLSCNHCATFHNETLDKIKENYVDTGKVKFVFHDFPINKQALFASVISRCMPEDKYYNFLQLLFKTQEQWAYTEEFAERLTKSAKMAGLSEDRINACFASEELQQGLIKQRQEAQENKNIRSTPTFIFGDSEGVIIGNKPYEAFEQKIQDHLDKK